MGFRFSKRISLGKLLGVNISRSGITPSVRTKFGSFGTKGFSLRTGIPGVGYRKSISGGTGCLVIIIGIITILIFK